MNDNNSTTEHKNSERLSDDKLLAKKKWKEIDWKQAEKEVNRLQTRIAKATKEKKFGIVKRLQYLLAHSFYAKALSVRKVTTNKGKKTAGIDKVIWKSAKTKMQAILSLTDKNYKAQPLRRVYVNKKNKKKKHPLGIPTMYDRAMQALYALTLDPVSESMADTHSFGFRKGRSCQDASKYLFNVLSRSYSPKWILEGDIEGCFDNISHNWLMENIPMDKPVLKQFLKAGFVFKDKLFPVEDGTPQGGIISPILANMALDGLQEEISLRFHTNFKGNIDKNWRDTHKVNLARYADDFVITAATKEFAEEAKIVVQNFLESRGLKLSNEKTVITNIDEGFDFLGWNYRKYNGKLLIKPSKSAVKNFVKTLSETVLDKGKALSQDTLIVKLNQKIRGFTNYHQGQVSSKTFSYIDFVLFSMLWRWAKRRHPHKGKKWIIRKYWHGKGSQSWVFSTDRNTLLRASHTPIVRHTSLKTSANPYLDTEYFAERKYKNGIRKLSGKFKTIWKNQNGCCFHCNLPMDINDEREIYLKIPKSNGGKEEVSNMVYVHKHCQQIYFESRSKE